MIDARLDFSVNVQRATQKLCRDLGIRYSEELSLKRQNYSRVVVILLLDIFLLMFSERVQIQTMKMDLGLSQSGQER